MGDAQRSRGWCLTVNNPTEALVAPENCYLVYQKEEGDNKTPHFQGVVYFNNQRTFKSVKKLFPRAHLDKMMGTLDQAEHYCTKPHDDCFCKHCKEGPKRLDGPWRHGEKPKGQGERIDYQQFYAQRYQFGHLLYVSHL